MPDLQALIDQGEQLRREDYDSPDVDMWQNDVKAAVTTFGPATIEVLDRAFWFGYAIHSKEHGQQMHNEMITEVQKLLENLQKRNPDDTQAQSRLISRKKEEAEISLKAKFGNTTINGPVTFGDNSPANNIQVGELMSAIISQAEGVLPEGEEKQKILTGLRSVLTNPTFAAMAGASLPEIIKHLVG